METTETTISKKEYIKASNLNSRLTVKKLIILAIFALVYSFIINSMNIRTFGQALIYTTAMIILVCLLLYCWRFYFVGRGYRLSPIVHQRYAIHFLENGLLFKSTTGENLLEWKYIIKWRQNKAFILVYLTPSQYSIIPKRLEANGLDIASLETALLTHVGKAK